MLLMPLPLLHTFSRKRQKIFLLCLILGGIRTLACPGLTARAKTCFHALKWCSRALKDLFNHFQTRGFPSTGPSPSAPVPRLTADSPYNLHCLSLPPDVTSSSATRESGCQEEPTAPYIQDTPLVNVPVGGSTKPYQGGYQRIAFEPTISIVESIHPLELCSATPNQLVPQRRPISRNDYSDIAKVYNHPNMTPENAARGYLPSYATDFTLKVSDIPGWKMFIHPLGTTYFHREERNVLTTMNLFNDNNFRVVEDAIKRLFLKIKDDDVVVPLDTQLVIDIAWEKHQVGYYFASLQKRCLFWAHDPHEMWGPGRRRRIPRTNLLSRVQSYMHLGRVYFSAPTELKHALCIRECFTNITEGFLTDGGNALKYCFLNLVREIKGQSSFLRAERIINLQATLQGVAETAERFSSIIDSVFDEVVESWADTDPRTAYYCCIVGRFMYKYSTHKLNNRYGQLNVRYIRDQPLFNDTSVQPRTAVTTLFSPILFYIPAKYLQALEKIVREDVTFVQPWHKFITELHQEWNGLAIFATVLLATDMAFLAIPSVDSGDHPEKRSAAQISCYLSILLSVGSIALGQILSRYHRIKGLENWDERVVDNSFLPLDIGRDRLAIMYSFPYAMLAWAVIAFLVAFLIMCFDGTTTVVRCLVGTTSAVFILAMVYCIYTMRSDDKERSAGSFVVRFNTIIRKLCSRSSSRTSFLRTNSDSVLFHSLPPSRPQPANVVQVPDV